MAWSFYVCPHSAIEAIKAANAAAKEGDRRFAWACSPTSDKSEPSDPVFGQVDWEHYWEDRERFEAQAGVIPLCWPWEPVPAAAVPVLEVFRQDMVTIRAERVGIATKSLLSPADNPAAAIDGTHTVAQALRKAFPRLV